MPYFMLCILEQSVFCTCSHLWQFSLLSSFLSCYFLIKFYTISQEASCSFCEVGNSSYFLLCRISEISQAIFLSLLSVWQAFMIFNGNFGFSVMSTWVHLPNPFFLQPHGTCDFILLQGKQAGRAHWIWLGQMRTFFFLNLRPGQRFKSISKLAVSKLQKHTF